MNSIKVSVIIPVYNTQAHLKQCLDSVLKQTLYEIEVIIVNDCSPDGSAEIIREYAKNDERVICVNHEVNKGLPAARNSGVSIAQGQYIIHLDSDDFWLDKNMLLTLYQTAEIDDCDILRFNGSHHTHGRNTRQILKSEDIVNGTFNAHQQFWVYKSVFLYVFRRSFLVDFGLKFIPGLTMGEDAIFLSSALPKARKISSISNCFYAYRMDNDSLMRSRWDMDDYIKEEKAARIVSNNIKHVKGAFIKYWSYRFNQYWSTKLMMRGFAELKSDERIRCLSFASETVAEIGAEELKNNKILSAEGEKLLALLLKKDTSSLDEYLIKLNALPDNSKAMRKSYLDIKWKLKSLSVRYYLKLKRIASRATTKIGIRGRLARFNMEDRVFSNAEGRSDYNFTLRNKGKTRGISAMLRVKNEEKNIVDCLDSIVECFDEIVVIDNGSTDLTVMLVNDFKNKHPLGQRVNLHSYPFVVARCGAEHQATDENSLKNLAYYYNWCLSRCQYTLVCKWDADMVLSSKMQNREIFKRYILSMVRSRRLYKGSISVQTVYIDKADNKFIAQDEINEEVRIFPNMPAIYFVKGWDWEILKVTFPVNHKVLKNPVVYELKDVKQDEFSHWSAESFAGERKITEFRNYMYIKKSMHLNDSRNFLKTNRL